MLQKLPRKKAVYKTAKATEKFIGNKIAEKIVKPQPVSGVNSRNEKIVIPPEKRQQIPNEFIQVL